MKKFRFTAIVMMLVALTLGIVNQNVNDRTMTGCKVSFVSNVVATPSPTEAITSCGYVYVGSHFGKDMLNIGKITDMNKALLSGKTVTIKGTGFGFLSAYDVTVDQ